MDKYKKLIEKNLHGQINEYNGKQDTQPLQLLHDAKSVVFHV